MSQFAFDLGLEPLFSEDNFFISDCNREAFQFVTECRWPSHVRYIHGPKGSGKTHLGQLWAFKSGARVVEADGLSASLLPAGNLLIENVENLKDERALLHLLNAAKENNLYMLLTSGQPAAQLPFTLPDLMSRLKAMPAAAIRAPDDEALMGALRKQFADRQLKVEDDVIAYLLPRIERSFFSARAIVEKLDACALAERRNLTVPFVKKALGY